MAFIAEYFSYMMQQEDALGICYVLPNYADYTTARLQNTIETPKGFDDDV
jgi:hypothetical protein